MGKPTHIFCLLAAASMVGASPIQNVRLRDTAETETRFWEVNGQLTQTVATVTYPASDSAASSAPGVTTSFATVSGPGKTVFSAPTSSASTPRHTPSDFPDAGTPSGSTNMKLIYGLSVSLIVVVFLFCALVFRMRRRIVATYTSGSAPIPRQFRTMRGRSSRPKKPKPIVLSDTQFALLPVVKAADNLRSGAESAEFEMTQITNGRRSNDKPGVTGEEGGEEADVCAVCLETMEDSAQLVELPCHHAYHTDCIKGWLLKKSDSCPLCKKSVLAGLGLPRIQPEEALPEAAATNAQGHATGVQPEQRVHPDSAPALPPAAHA